MTSSLLGAPAWLKSPPPNEHRVPERVRTWGAEARELGEVAGIVCQPWQGLVLDDMLGERADGRWAAREAGLTVPRQNGKSVVAVLRVLAGLYIFGEELVVYTAHQVDTAEEIFARIIDAIKSTPELRSRGWKPSYARGNKGVTVFNPTQRMLVKARSKESIRGFSADVLMLDEAQLGLDEADMAALGPTQRARPNPQTVYMGTPALTAGTYWGRLRRRALASDPKFSWAEWSPPKGYDRTDRAVWRATNPAFGLLIDEEAIEHDLKTLGSKFDAEALGAWPDEGDDAGWEVFAEHDWRLALDAESAIDGAPGFAIEASHDLSHLSIGAAGRRADGQRHLELVARFPADTGRLVGWLKKRITTWKPTGVAIDPAGPAGYLIGDVERHCDIEVVKPLGRDVAAACASVYVGITGEPDARDVRVRLAGGGLDAALNSAARLAVWRPRGDARAFDRRADDADVAPLLAVTLADYVASRRPAPRARPRAVYG